MDQQKFEHFELLPLLLYLCPCIIYKSDESYQPDATILFIIINNRTRFGHLYAHLQEYIQEYIRLDTNLHTVHKTTHRLLRISATMPSAEHHVQ